MKNCNSVLAGLCNMRTKIYDFIQYNVKVDNVIKIFKTTINKVCFQFEYDNEKT